ncbi:MAG: hypothetical protein M1600_14030 [Firmicutes bacterium]|jgi:hypothetical protein|nr:hypothetical protein [Bacillota bacterium]
MALSDETGEDPWSNWQVFDPVAEVLKTGSGPAIRLGGGRPVIAPEVLVTPYQVDCEVFFEEARGFAGVGFGAVDQDA